MKPITPDHETILDNATPIWISEERTLYKHDTFKGEYAHELRKPLTARWVLLRMDAPALTVEQRKIP